MAAHGGNIYQVERLYHIPKKEIYDFSSNINPLGIPESVKAYAMEHFDLVTSYPDSDYRELRERLAEYSGVPSEQVLLGNGASQLLYSYLNLLRPRSVLIVAPTFSEYARALEGSDALIDYFALKEEDNFTVQVEALCARLTRGYDLFVMCNPNNPTSTYCNLDGLQKIVETVRKYATHFLLDESFIEFQESGLQGSILNLEEKPYYNLFILRSLTKFYAVPGLRLGYAITPNKEIFEKVRHMMGPWPINTLAAMIGEKMLGLEDYARQSRQLITTEKAVLYSLLREQSYLKVYKPEVNFVLVKLPETMSAPEVKEALLTHKILVRDASDFMFLDNSFIRLAVKDRASNQYLIEKMAALW